MVMHPVEDAVGPVDRAQRALHPRPVLVAVVRHGGVRVLQPGVEHEPEVHPEVGQEVVHQHGLPAEGGGGPGQAEEGDGDAEGRQRDAVRPVHGEELRVGAEVVDEARHGLAERLAVQPPAAGDVEEEVHGPAEEEVADEVEAGEGVVAEQVVHHVKLDRLQLLLGVGHVRLAVHEVVRLRVVLAVRVLPGEVRDEEQGVQDPPDAVVQRLAV
mmetsp:Transcript_33704/g.100063  ORF Transcript_33704/g.100063 Transcript_33704/m.100063 type:complete len:213 (+) Transcript_33704:636-1274(+)